MRRGYQSNYTPDHGSVELGQTHAVIRNKQGRTLIATILEQQRGDDGLLRVTLDRVVHDRHQSRLGDFKCEGVYATELSEMSKQDLRSSF